MRHTIVLAISIFFAGFSQLSLAEPKNLFLTKQVLKRYHDSGDYEQELTQVVNQARAFIKQRLTDNARQPKPQKLALVFDIDETSLSNYKGMVKLRFGGTLFTINKSLERADLVPIAPVLDLYNYAKNNQIALFFVTGRHESQRQITRDNLIQAGFTHWQALILKPAGYKQASVVPYKSGARKKITEQGYTIIATIGDQKSDLAGGYAEKGFKLPNPFYYIP